MNGLPEVRFGSNGRLRSLLPERPVMAHSLRSAYDGFTPESCPSRQTFGGQEFTLSGLLPFASPRPSNGEKFTNA